MTKLTQSEQVIRNQADPAATSKMLLMRYEVLRRNKSQTHVQRPVTRGIKELDEKIYATLMCVYQAKSERQEVIS